MPSTVKELQSFRKAKNKKALSLGVENKMSMDDNFEDEFDFVDAYSDESETVDEELLPENTAKSAINCAFIGVGGGGGKLAKAFLDIGFNRTLLVNTTEKDQPDGIDENNFLLIPGSDGVGKDVELGTKILEENSTLIEDSVRARLAPVVHVAFFTSLYLGAFRAQAGPGAWFISYLSLALRSF